MEILHLFIASLMQGLAEARFLLGFGVGEDGSQLGGASMVSKIPP
jgi:hypothetical protein